MGKWENFTFIKKNFIDKMNSHSKLMSKYNLALKSGLSEHEFYGNSLEILTYCPSLHNDRLQLDILWHNCMVVKTINLDNFDSQFNCTT